MVRHAKGAVKTGHRAKAGLKVARRVRGALGIAPRCRVDRDEERAKGARGPTALATVHRPLRLRAVRARELKRALQVVRPFLPIRALAPNTFSRERARRRSWGRSILASASHVLAE